MSRVAGGQGVGGSSVKPRGRQRPSPSDPITEADVPRDLDAERAVLGAILVADGALARARRTLNTDDFFPDHHQRIFAAAIALQGSGKMIDPVLLKGELSDRGELEIVGGPAYIASLVDGLPQSANVDFYAERVKEKSDRRAMQQRGLLFTKACGNGHDLAELIEASGALHRAALAADPAAVRRVRPTSEVAAEYSASVARGKARKLWTGIGPIDTATAGLNPGEVLTGVARPQVGKSALASQIVINASLAGEPCLFVSLEMPREQAFERLVMQRLGVSRSRVEEMAAGNWAGLRPEQRTGLDALSRDVVIVDVGKSSVADLDGAMVEATAILKRAPRLVAVDYLGLLGSGAKNRPLYERVSEAAVDVKSFAKRHQAAVILLSQAGREQDRKRSEGAAELGLDAGRDSGQTEEACDFLLTLWRPELDTGLKPEDRREVSGQLFMSVCKNRRGPRLTCQLLFDRETLRICDWPEEG